MCNANHCQMLRCLVSKVGAYCRGKKRTEERILVDRRTVSRRSAEPHATQHVRVPSFCEELETTASGSGFLLLFGEVALITAKQSLRVGGQDIDLAADRFGLAGLEAADAEIG